MNSAKRDSIWLLIASCVIIGAALISFVRSPDGLSGFAFGVALLLAAMLLRRMRSAWLILLISAGWGTVAAAINEGYGGVFASLVVVGCLAAPPSVRVVWMQNGHSATTLTRTSDLFTRVRTLFYALVGRLAAWEMDAAEDERSYATLLTRLGFACLLLLPVMSGTEGWHQKSAGNSLASIVAGVSWVCYFLCLAAFVVVLALAGFRQLARKRMMNIK